MASSPAFSFTSGFKELHGIGRPDKLHKACIVGSSTSPISTCFCLIQAIVALTTVSFVPGEHIPFGIDTPVNLARARTNGSSSASMVRLVGTLFRSQSTDAVRDSLAIDGASGSIGTGIPDKLANARMAGSSSSLRFGGFDLTQLTESSTIDLFILGFMDPEGNAIPARFARAWTVGSSIFSGSGSFVRNQSTTSSMSDARILLRGRFVATVGSTNFDNAWSDGPFDFSNWGSFSRNHDIESDTIFFFLSFSILPFGIVISATFASVWTVASAILSGHGLFFRIHSIASDMAFSLILGWRGFEARGRPAILQSAWIAGSSSSLFFGPTFLIQSTASSTIDCFFCRGILPFDREIPAKLAKAATVGSSKCFERGVLLCLNQFTTSSITECFVSSDRALCGKGMLATLVRHNIVGSSKRATSGLLFRSQDTAWSTASFFWSGDILSIGTDEVPVRFVNAWIDEGSWKCSATISGCAFRTQLMKSSNAFFFASGSKGFDGSGKPARLQRAAAVGSSKSVLFAELVLNQSIALFVISLLIVCDREPSGNSILAIWAIAWTAGSLRSSAVGFV